MLQVKKWRERIFFKCEMASGVHPQTPKKTYKSSASGKLSCCRLCRSTSEVHFKNIFAKANRVLLIAAEDVYGQSLRIAIALKLTKENTTKVLKFEDPSLTFSFVSEPRDQTRPGSLFSRSWGRGERDPGNEVDKRTDHFFGKYYTTFFNLGTFVKL